MANFFDYLDWRGELPFASEPINDIDNMLFCELSYMDWTGIVPGPIAGGCVSLSDAYTVYRELHAETLDKPLGLIIPRDIVPLAQKMALCKRFEQIPMLAYTEILQYDAEEQFSAVTFRLPDGALFVAFRGTDDTITGWKENLNMGLGKAVPAQTDSVAYLARIAEQYPDVPLYIGGHSKGGNLAIYAAVMSEPAVRARISRVWSNDGPGFTDALIGLPSYAELQERITSIVPENSIIGRMLSHDGRFTVVKSDVNGLWQHDAFTWNLLGKDFVQAGALSAQSDDIDRSLKNWLETLSAEEREQLIASIYAILRSTHTWTLTDLTKDVTWFWKVMKSADQNDIKFVFSKLTAITGEAGKVWMERVLPFLSRNSGNRMHASPSGTLEETVPTVPLTAQKKQSQNVKRVAYTATRVTNNVKQKANAELKVAKARAEAATAKVKSGAKAVSDKTAAKTDQFKDYAEIRCRQTGKMLQKATKKTVHTAKNLCREFVSIVSPEK